MSKETKIILPIYKIIYATCFVVLLSLVRGIIFTNEIGVAIEAPFAILVVVFCADTYVMEISSKRSEIAKLYPVKNRCHSLYLRLMIQILFLSILACIGYGLFLIFQNPSSMNPSADLVNNAVLQEAKQFIIFTISILVTVGFWGSLSNLFACVTRNTWAGIGGCIILWLGFNSKAGDMLLGKWNVFSYTFRDIQNEADFSWLYGKGICICIMVLIIRLVPIIMKKRG